MPYEIHDISSGRLKFGYWYLNHKEKIRKILVILLAAFGGLALAYGIYGFTIHYLELPKINSLLQSMQSTGVDFAAFNQRNAPKDLVVQTPIVIYTGNNRYDIFARVENPNANYAAANLRFSFSSGSFASPESDFYLFPGQTAYLVSYANFSQQRLSTASLKIAGLQWEKIKINSDFPNVDFTLGNLSFSQDSTTKQNRVSFLATNDTLFNFRQVDWQIILYSGSRVIGFNQVSTNDFLSGQSREVVLSWFENLPRFSRVEVFPVANLNDQSLIYQTAGQPDQLIDF